MVNDELVTTCKSCRFSNKDCLWKQSRHLPSNLCTFKYILHLTFVLDQFYFHSFHQTLTRGWGVRVELPQSEQETELKLSKPWQMSVCFIKYVSQRKQRGRDNPRQDFLNTEYQHWQMTEWRGEMCNVSQHQSYTALGPGYFSRSEAAGKRQESAWCASKTDCSTLYSSRKYILYLR